MFRSSCRRCRTGRVLIKTENGTNAYRHCHCVCHSLPPPPPPPSPSPPPPSPSPPPPSPSRRRRRLRRRRRPLAHSPSPPSPSPSPPSPSPSPPPPSPGQSSRAAALAHAVARHRPRRARHARSAAECTTPVTQAPTATHTHRENQPKGAYICCRECSEECIPSTRVLWDRCAPPTCVPAILSSCTCSHTQSTDFTQVTKRPSSLALNKHTVHSNFMCQSTAQLEQVYMYVGCGYVPSLAQFHVLPPLSFTST